MSMRTAVVAGVIVAGAAMVAAEQVPKGYRQVVPRGVIESHRSASLRPGG